jgi:hypothetical protein
VNFGVSIGTEKGKEKSLTLILLPRKDKPPPRPPPGAR